MKLLLYKVLEIVLSRKDAVQLVNASTAFIAVGAMAVLLLKLTG